MSHEECHKIYQAGKTLLVKSKLVHFDGHSFVDEKDEDQCELYWSRHFDEDFGRYMAWVWFSVGAENLAKAALVCNGKLTAEKVNFDFPFYSPVIDETEWIEEVLKPKMGNSLSERAYNYNYRSLGNLVGKLGKLNQVGEAEKKCLTAAYKYLTAVIRNRDAHTYVENVRRKDFPAVKGLFVPAFNTLLRTMSTKDHL